MYIKFFKEISKEDLPTVGGKGANLGELSKLDLEVPPGFCVTTKAYNEFVELSDLKGTLKTMVDEFVEAGDDYGSSKVISDKIQEAIKNTPVPDIIQESIRTAYKQLSTTIGIENIRVAVRSSATAEDLPDASFAGQQDTYLHISGEESLIKHIVDCWSSLWTNRALYYRIVQNYNHFEVGISVVVQKMANAKKSGVMFTVNPINNNINQAVINSSYGLGEAVVSGMVTPDEYIVDKDSLEVIEETIANKKIMVVEQGDAVGTKTVAVNDYLGDGFSTKSSLSKDEIFKLMKAGMDIEKHYNSPQDIEWAIDDDTKELYILQARPITTLKKGDVKEMEEVTSNKVVLCKGLGASPGVVCGKVKIINSIEEIDLIEDGDILVSIMTNPDMVPAMRKAVGVITDEGGRTCHAAIVSRELGIPCIVGSETATEVLKNGQLITMDSNTGIIYEGRTVKAKVDTPKGEGLSFNKEELLYDLAPVTGTKIYMNLGEPSMIEKYKNYPFDGIGLMRTEFIFSNMIGIHPMYLIKQGRQDFFIEKLSEGITTVVSEIYPKPVILRMSDFRTNEFANLEGGKEMEPFESNPMIGFRGVSRYISDKYEEGFRLECKAIKKVRVEYGLTNLHVMLPFVRTLDELKKAISIMEEEGLKRNNDFKLWIMAEVPSVVFMADEFAKLVDGFSIGSNDLTQLIMGADRDSGILNAMGYFDERNEAVKRAIRHLIKTAHENGITISICGQGPSTYREFSEFLVKEGIDSVSVNPDTVYSTRKLIASIEQRMILDALRK